MFETKNGSRGEFFLTQRRDAPATKSSGCLSEANPKGRKGLREAESLTFLTGLTGLTGLGNESLLCDEKF